MNDKLLELPKFNKLNEENRRKITEAMMILYDLADDSSLSERRRALCECASTAIEWLDEEHEKSFANQNLSYQQVIKELCDGTIECMELEVEEGNI